MCYQRVCVLLFYSLLFAIGIKSYEIWWRKIVLTLRGCISTESDTRHTSVCEHKNRIKWEWKSWGHMSTHGIFYDTFCSTENSFSSVWSTFREAKVPLPHSGCSAGCLCLCVCVFKCERSSFSSGSRRSCAACGRLIPFCLTATGSDRRLDSIFGLQIEQRIKINEQIKLK